MQAAPSSIPTSGTFFRGDLVMKTFLRSFSLFRWFKKSSCQLLAKECALSTGKLLRRLAQEQCGWVNWPRPKWPKMCRRAVKQKSNQIKDTHSLKTAIIVSQNSKFCIQNKFPTGKCYEGEVLYCLSIIYLFHGYVCFSFYAYMHLTMENLWE